MTEQEKLTTIAENMPKVFENGKRDGRREAYDAFWDSYHNDIPETGDYRFAGAGWNNTTFKPTKSMKPINATGMFRRNRFNGDMVELFKQQGITLDFSECTAMTYVFYECSASRIGVIDGTKSANLTAIFGYMYNCHTIDLVKVQRNNYFNDNSFRCSKLVEIRFEGEIGNAINFQWSTLLSHDSLMSILNALQDLSSTGTSRTCTLGATNLAKLTDEEKLVATRKGWSLA